MAQSADLSAESAQLIQQSNTLSTSNLIDLVHSLTLLSPDSADKVLEQTLASRDSWSDLDLASVFAAVVSALPETRDALVKHPDVVQTAIETGAVDTTKIIEPMAVTLLNIIASASNIDDEQRSRVGAIIAHAVVHAGDTAAINRLANGELLDGSSDVHDEEVQAKEDPRSHASVLADYEEALDDFESSSDDSAPGDTTSDN